MRKTLFEDLTEIKEVFSNGEVFTPTFLVEEMLDQIPEHIYLNKNSKFLDPCCGTGTFLKALVSRLKNKYNWSPDEIKNGVYGLDLNPFYSNMLESKGLKHVYQGDYLTFDFK